MENKELNFENETRKHQQLVSRYINIFAQELLKRANCHDKSKLENPERKQFVEYTEKLKDMEYGSEEYKKCMEEMKETLKHHYSLNKHHPEYWEINGWAFETLYDPIRAMDLADIAEMICDWLAACKRHKNGSIYDSIEKNKERFGINDQLCYILNQTANMLECRLKKEKL
jgi:hypothetical protein